MSGFDSRQAQPRTFEYFGEGLFTAAVKKGSLDWTVFQRLITIMNISAGLAVPAFIAGGISCLGVQKKTADAKACWISQRERLQTYIYLSAALLVIAVVLLKTWTQYPSFILNKDAMTAYNAVVNSFSVFTGIEYTLLLAAYALPVSFFLSQRADHIAQQIRKHEPQATVREIRAREKLAISTQDIFKSVIALLSPLITGSVASLASAIS
jgi:hypothetical protein